MSRLRAQRSVAAVILVLLVLGMALAAAGCGGKSDPAAGSAKLTEADNGKQIAAKVGDTIEVTLAGNPTTGYSWTSSMSDADKAVLQQQGEPAYVQQSTDKSLVGGGGTFTFAFKAIAPGQATIKLDYARPFEAGVAPIQTFSAIVTVK
jgi:inhibitor of cysteine peptidase